MVSVFLQRLQRVIIHFYISSCQSLISHQLNVIKRQEYMHEAALRLKLYSNQLFLSSRIGLDIHKIHHRTQTDRDEVQHGDLSTCWQI